MHLFTAPSSRIGQAISSQHVDLVLYNGSSRGHRCRAMGTDRTGLQGSKKACKVMASPETASSMPAHHIPSGRNAACINRPAVAALDYSDVHSESACQSLASHGQGPGTQTMGNNIVPVVAATTMQAVKQGNGNARPTAQLPQPMHTAADALEQHHVWLPDKQLWVPPGSKSASPAAREGFAVNPSRTSQLQRVYMAAAATRGRKKSMEDRHVLAALDPARGVQQAHGPVRLHQQVSVGAVFDGHAGYATAAYAAQYIPHLLHEALSGRPGKSDGGPRVPHKELLCPPNALAASFHWFDHWWADARCDPSLTEHGWDDSGSTAVVGLVSGQQLIVANAGDSIALLARDGVSQRLSVEHRLDNLAEAERVLEAGGRVVSFKPGAAPRVMGTSTQTRFKGSMVTRSLGDFAFKHPQALISADPHVAQEELHPSDKLVVLTSDGVTDVLPDDDCLEAALRAIEQTQQCTNSGQALAKAAAMAIMTAALEAGSTDNITVVCMLLDWGCEYAAD